MQKSLVDLALHGKTALLIDWALLLYLTSAEGKCSSIVTWKKLVMIRKLRGAQRPCRVE